MNMFKRGRKAKDQLEPFEPMFMGDGSTTTFKSGRMTKKKGKLVMEEKPAFSLDTALPQTDDFRTSLIMPGLSARFSMLREQDDPHSKMGKAADDSVLFPKRASRLNLFGHTQHALGDIAEVESIRSSFKPPFADRERSNSFGDGYDSDNGSVMSRSRPGEGNNLFGGRQKLYRIATGSGRNVNEVDSPTIGGKHMYESDVSLSLFQQYRRREREARQAEEEESISPAIDAYDSDAVHSPTIGHHEYNQNWVKRATQSSTNSAASNLRASTTATSVGSDSPNLQLGHPQTNGEKSTSTSPDLRKFRDEVPRPSRQLSQSKSAANMREKFRPAGIYSASALRSASPALPAYPASAGAAQPLDFGFGELKNSLRSQRQTNSPTPQVNGDAGSVLASSVHANDRGKATAMGLFNKPAKEFDEQQYLQRQLQMHEGRNSPMQTGSRSQSRASSEVQRTGSALRATPSPVPSDVFATTPIPPLPSKPSSPQRNGERNSKESSSSPAKQAQSSRPRSKSSASATAKDNVKARVESLIRRQNAELALLESEKLGGSRPQTILDSHQQNSEAQSTFLDDNDDESSVADSRSSAMRQSTADSLRMPDGDIHPAFRSSFATSTTSSQFSKSKSVADENKDDNEKGRDHLLSDDTDNLDAPLNFGLSGLIRSHLRHDSDKSVGISTILQHSPTERDTTTDTTSSTYITTFDGGLLNPGQPTSGPPTPTTAMSQRAQQMLSRAQALQAGTYPTKPSLEIDDEASDYGDDDEAQESTFQSHQRGDSSATTKERREFDEELAKRRLKIREGLKSVVEREHSQSPKPVRGREHTLQAFAQPGDEQNLPQRNRREQWSDAQTDQFSRAGSEYRQGSSAKSSAEYYDSRSGFNDNMQNGNVSSSQSRSASSAARYREGNGSRSITPPSNKYGRSRSNSTTTDRSKINQINRNGPSPPLPNVPPYSPTNSRSPVQYYEQANSPRDTRSRAASNAAYHSSQSTGPFSDTFSNGSRPLPTSPTSPFIEGNAPTQQQYSISRATSNPTGRSTPQGGRKRSGTKTQISEPMFISSTASVPLIPLPQGLENQSPPPLPEMNPRRRGTNGLDKPFGMLNINLSNSLRLPLETVPASPRFPEEIRSSSDDVSSTKPRPKLRKSSSEGGNLASTARQQAIYAELQREKNLSPTIPNRSATALGLTQEGGMF